jgi:DNA-binding CsgD family transcriptional regulator
MTERTEHCVRLGTVQETLLIPLYGRAVENRKQEAALRDPRAEEIVASIDYDFGRFDNLPSLIGAVLRTSLFDLRVAARGDALLAPSITRKLINWYVAQPLPTGTGKGLEELTSREREAVALVAQGLSNDEIADHMVISPMTAKTHINRAMTKLHARDRAQLMVLAYESGLVAPRSS